MRDTQRVVTMGNGARWWGKLGDSCGWGMMDACVRFRRNALVITIDVFVVTMEKGGEIAVESTDDHRSLCGRG